MDFINQWGRPEGSRSTESRRRRRRRRRRGGRANYKHLR